MRLLLALIVPLLKLPESAIREGSKEFRIENVEITKSECPAECVRDIRKTFDK